MSLMGVDVGTTGVKAVVFSGSGGILSTAYEEYPLLFPFPGAAELDSEGVIQAAFHVIRDAAGKAEGADPVAAIGIASQGEAFTPVASDGSMLGNGMTSSDCRAQDIVGPWSEDFGVRRIYEITGHTPYSMYSLYKLLWLKKRRPDVWDRTWKFLFYEDLLAYALTGETAVDYTMAARSMLFDVRKKAWSSEILEKLELSAERLSDAVPSGAVIGTVRSAQADDLGMQPRVKVSVCGHDQPVGALGCGAAMPGHASYSIGTVECVCASADRAILTPELMKSNLAMYPHVLPDAYATVAFNITGGSVLRWVRDELSSTEVADAKASGADPYDLIIASASTDPANVILLPHFGPTGTPHFDSTGAGALFGLKLSTTKAEVIRAALEGITYEMRWNLAILRDAGFDLSELRAVGGGAKSDIWMQIKADILGIPLTVMQVPEATCMGAAILAGDGIGLLDASDAVGRRAIPIGSFTPRGEYASMYEDRFAIYRELYGATTKAREMLQQMERD